MLSASRWRGSPVALAISLSLLPGCSGDADPHDRSAAATSAPSPDEPPIRTYRPVGEPVRMKAVPTPAVGIARLDMLPRKQTDSVEDAEQLALRAAQLLIDARGHTAGTRIAEA